MESCCFQCPQCPCEPGEFLEVPPQVKASAEFVVETTKAAGRLLTGAEKVKEVATKVVNELPAGWLELLVPNDEGHLLVKLFSILSTLFLAATSALDLATDLEPCYLLGSIWYLGVT